MSLDKSIHAGNERRKPYYRSGRHDKTCRPHGACPWCRRGRTHFDTRRRLAAEADMREPE